MGLLLQSLFKIYRINFSSSPSNFQLFKTLCYCPFLYQQSVTPPLAAPSKLISLSKGYAILIIYVYHKKDKSSFGLLNFMCFLLREDMIAAHQNRIAQLRDSFKQKMLEADSWPKKVNFIQIVCMRSIVCF